MRALQEFIDKMRGVESLDNLRDIFRDTVEEAGFRFFAYHITRVAGVGSHLPYYVGTYPSDWVSHYVEADYLHHDPVILEGPRRQLPFRWADLVRPADLTDKQRVMFSEAMGSGVFNGLTVPIHGRDGEFASMSLVPFGSGREQTEVVEQNMHMVHLLALYYHNHTGSYLLEQHLRREKPVLTARERETLTWVARGKSSWEISQILNVAERTVLYHIENAKTKLDVTSRTHLVVKAIMENLIEP